MYLIILSSGKTISIEYCNLFAGGTFTLISNSDDHLIATFTFPNIQERFNNSDIVCRDSMLESNNFTFYLAGVYTHT